MRISIAMATYNGAQYLQEQLDSFLCQTRLPDELVVCDDRSIDATVDILEAFRTQAPFAVHIYLNDTNLGHVKNFERTMSRCTGDIVFLSDQDDVWLPSKLETVAQKFLASPEVLAVTNDASLVDEKLRDSGLTMNGQFSALGLTHTRYLYGCCAAIRGSLLPLLLPIPNVSTFRHDTWLRDVVTRLEGRETIDETLQYHRRHGNNASGFLVTKTTPVNRLDLARAFKDQDPRVGCQIRLRELEALRERIDGQGKATLVALGLGMKIPHALQSIDFEVAAVESRLRLLKRSRLKRALPAVLMYARGQYSYFTGWRSLAKDVYRE